LEDPPQVIRGAGAPPMTPIAGLHLRPLRHLRQKDASMNRYLNTPFNLAGRSALVTGGSRGLGLEMARILAQAGADVAICSRNRAEIDAAAAKLAAETGAKVIGLQADTGKRPEAEQLARDAVARLGKVDILISNAGWNIPQPIEKIRDEDWDSLLELNVTSSMVLSRALAPGMMERKWGRMVYISSIMAHASTEERVAYSTTKVALHGMMKANALHLGPHGITVNCISPGPFATDMPMSILSKEQQAKLAGRTAVNRWGQPPELAPAALLLSSDAGAYINGTVLVVDGGALARMW
jgi:NAD(P)-dependent dehydrogenase (short-subunit alcohol dehydrogenase family)